MSCYFILGKRNPGSRGAHSHMGPRPVRPKNGGNPLGNPGFQGPPPGSQSATPRNHPPPLLGAFINFSSIWSDMGASFGRNGPFTAADCNFQDFGGARFFAEFSEKHFPEKYFFLYKSMLNVERQGGKRFFDYEFKSIVFFENHFSARESRLSPARIPPGEDFPGALRRGRKMRR